MNWESIYKKIARENGVSVEEVKREIRAAINFAYIHPNFHAQCVLRQGEIPTPEEFMSHIARRVKSINMGHCQK